MCSYLQATRICQVQHTKVYKTTLSALSGKLAQGIDTNVHQLATGSCMALVDAKVRSSSLTGLPKEDHVPRMHMMAGRRTVKLRRHLSHPMTIEYGFSHLCDNILTRRL